MRCRLRAAPRILAEVRSDGRVIPGLPTTQRAIDAAYHPLHEQHLTAIIATATRSARGRNRYTAGAAARATANSSDDAQRVTNSAGKGPTEIRVPTVPRQRRYRLNERAATRSACSTCNSALCPANAAFIRRRHSHRSNAVTRTVYSLKAGPQAVARAGARLRRGTIAPLFGYLRECGREHESLVRGASDREVLSWAFRTATAVPARNPTPPRAVHANPRVGSPGTELEFAL